MMTMIMKELKSRRLMLLGFCIATFGFLWLYISLWPFIQSQSQSYTKLLDSFPKGFSQAFGIDANFLTSIEGYLGGEMYTLIWPLLAIILAVSGAGSTLAGEIEKGTIGTLLSQPFSRVRLAASKYVAGLITLVVFVFASVVLAIPLAAVYRVTFWSYNFWVLSLLALLFGLAVYSFAFFVSAVSSERTRVYAISGGVLLIMYVANIISGLKANLSWLKYVSAFHYFNSSSALLSGRLDSLSIAVFTLSILLFAALGFIGFSRRDISV